MTTDKWDSLSFVYVGDDMLSVCRIDEQNSLTTEFDDLARSHMIANSDIIIRYCNYSHPGFLRSIL